jgi:hypothetical protein
MLYRRRPQPFWTANHRAPFILISAFLLAAVVIAPAVAFQMAAGTEGLSPSETDELNNMETEDDIDIVFKPPVIGAPGDRIGAGTRSGVSLVRRIELLVPKGGGLTAAGSPTLHWWLSKQFTGTVQIKIESIDDKQPVLEMRRSIDAKAGVQSLDLARLGLELDKRKIYVWKIILRKSDDVAWASGLSFIERVSTPASAEAGNPVQRARALAQAGIWYDALAQLADDPKLEKQRNSLLKSAGFTFMLGQ